MSKLVRLIRQRNSTPARRVAVLILAATVLLCSAVSTASFDGTSGTVLRLAPGGFIELQMHYTASGGCDRSDEARVDLREGATSARVVRWPVRERDALDLRREIRTTAWTRKSGSCRT